MLRHSRRYFLYWSPASILTMLIHKKIINTLGLVCLTSVATLTGGKLFAATPQLPQAYVDTNIADTPVTGNSIPVNAGDDLQAALNKANPGDEVVLQAG